MIDDTHKITRLVFCGGGAKGAVYPGAYAALMESGVFNDVLDIAGSSAGAFTAAFMAVGTAPSELQRDLLNPEFSFSKLLGDYSNPSWFTKDGKPLYDYLHRKIKESILTFLRNKPLDESHDCWKLLKNLEQTDKDYGPTFSDLEQLIKFWPERFKRLTITAVKEEGGELKIFNSHDTPNIEIALACRASGALPVFLTPVKIEGVNYIDGGVQENIPTESFDLNPTTPHTYTNNHPKNTLVFAFLDGQPHEKKTVLTQLFEYFFGSDSVFNALHGSRKDEHDNLELFKELLDQVEIELNKKIESNTQNTPIKTLIDEAIETVEAKYKHYNWSWIMHVFTAIINAIFAVWNFICGLIFKTPVVDKPKKESNGSTAYLNIIRDKLKEAASQIPDDSTEKTEHASFIWDHTKRNMHQKLHMQGPNKPPALFESQFVTFHAYNLVPKWLSAFNADYHPGNKLEESFQRVRSHYPLRTVALGIGHLSAIDFDNATKHARFLSARGYLDTMNTLLNLCLHQAENPDLFYVEMVNKFTTIYQQLIAVQNKPNQDPLLTQLTEEKLSFLSKYYLIKETAELDLDSDQTFALTCAVEYRRQEISDNEISAQIQERCRIQAERPANNSNSFFQSEPEPLLFRIGARLASAF